MKCKNVPWVLTNLCNHKYIYGLFQNLLLCAHIHQIPCSVVSLNWTLIVAPDSQEAVKEHKKKVDKCERCSMCSEMFVKMSGKREHWGEVDSFPIELQAMLRSTRSQQKRHLWPAENLLIGSLTLLPFLDSTFLCLLQTCQSALLALFSQTYTLCQPNSVNRIVFKTFSID